MNQLGTIHIKASGIQHLTDARYFAAREVTWLSFNLTPTDSDYIAPTTAKALFEWVEGVKIVAEINDQNDAETLWAAVKMLDYEGLILQVGQHCELATAEQLYVQNIPLIKEWVLVQATKIEDLTQQMQAFQPFVSAFQLNLQKNNIDWHTKDLLPLCEKYPIILACDIADTDDLAQIVATLPLHGLVLRGGDEERTGVKSFDELDTLLDWVEEIKS